MNSLIYGAEGSDKLAFAPEPNIRVFLQQRKRDGIPMLPGDTGKELCAKIGSLQLCLDRAAIARITHITQAPPWKTALPTERMSGR